VNSRERIQTLLKFDEPDRIGLMDSFWTDTLSRWHGEGLDPGIRPAEQFGFDFEHLYIDTSLRLPERLLEETEEYTVREDKHGFVAKQWKDRAGALGYLSHAIEGRSSWEELKPRLRADFGKGCRVHTVSYFEPFVEWIEWEQLRKESEELQQQGRFVLAVAYGPFEGIWRAHGFEETLIDLAANPGFAREMFETHVSLVIEVLGEGLQRGIEFDGLFLIEDMGFRSGPLMAPKVYRELLFPGHRRLGDFLKSRDLAYFLHSDGDVRRLIPDFVNAGVGVLQPLEARAGLDVRKLKREYGRDLAFMGNIDADKLSGTREEIEREVCEKVEIAKEGGGYIYHSDHSVPSSVSLGNYRFLLECLNRYGGYI